MVVVSHLFLFLWKSFRGGFDSCESNPPLFRTIYFPTAPFHFEEVNVDEALKSNHQLRHPAIAPEKRKEFFEGIKNGKKYDAVVAKIYPKACIKQRIKKILYSVRGGSMRSID